MEPAFPASPRSRLISHPQFTGYLLHWRTPEQILRTRIHRYRHEHPEELQVPGMESASSRSVRSSSTCSIIPNFAIPAHDISSPTFGLTTGTVNPPTSILGIVPRRRCFTETDPVQGKLQLLTLRSVTNQKGDPCGSPFSFCSLLGRMFSWPQSAQSQAAFHSPA